MGCLRTIILRVFASAIAWVGVRESDTIRQPDRASVAAGARFAARSNAQVHGSILDEPTVQHLFFVLQALLAIFGVAAIIWTVARVLMTWRVRRLIAAFFATEPIRAGFQHALYVVWIPRILSSANTLILSVPLPRLGTTMTDSESPDGLKGLAGSKSTLPGR